MSADGPRRAVFWIILLVMVLGIAEALSRLVMSLSTATTLSLKHYRARLESAQAIRFEPRTHSLFPLPDRDYVSFSSEFLHENRTARLPSLDVGLHDDGIDADRPLKVLAMGDSFTVGVGSIHPLRLGWVEMTEKMLPGVDVIGFAHSGSQPRGYLARYRAAAAWIPHDVVLVGLFIGNDFGDSLADHDINHALARVAARDPAFDPTAAAIRMPTAAAIRMQIEANFDAGCEALSARPWWPASLLLLGKAINMVPAAPEWLRALLPTCPTADWQPAARVATARQVMAAAAPLPGEDEIPEELRHRAASRLGFVYHDPRTGARFDIPAEVQDPEYGRAAARFLAGIVNRFAAETAAQGKRFLLVIHPDKLLVYGDRMGGEGTLPWTPNHTRRLVDRLKAALGLPTGAGETRLPPAALSEPGWRPALEAFRSALSPDLPVLDLGPVLRAAREKAPAPLFWRIDDHYKPWGYVVAAEAICGWLAEKLDRPSPAGYCHPPASVRQEALELSRQ